MLTRDKNGLFFGSRFIKKIVIPSQIYRCCLFFVLSRPNDIDDIFTYSHYCFLLVRCRKINQSRSLFVQRIGHNARGAVTVAQSTLKHNKTQLHIVHRLAHDIYKHFK